MGPSVFDVFLSYAHKDYVLVRPIAEALAARGLSVWMDCERLTPTVFDFPERVNDALINSKSILVALSDNYVSSFYCIQELTNAIIRYSSPAFPLAFIILPMTSDEAVGAAEIGGNQPMWLQRTPHLDIAAALEKLALVSQSKQSGVSFLSPLDWFNRVMKRLDSLEYTLSESGKSFLRNRVVPLCQLDLATRLHESGRYREALDVIQALINSSKERDLPPVIATAANCRLGVVLKRMGDISGAVRITGAEYAKLISSESQFDSEAVVVGCELAEGLVLADRAEEALSLLLELEPVALKELGAHHPLSERLANAICAIFLETKQYSKARRQLAPIVQRSLRPLAEPLDDERITRWMNYAVACMLTRDYLEAEPLLTDCFQALTRLKGPSHPDAILAAIKLAECESRSGKKQVAFRRIVAAFRQLERSEVSAQFCCYQAMIGLQCAMAVNEESYARDLYEKYVLTYIESGAPGTDSVVSFFHENEDLVPRSRVQRGKPTNAQIIPFRTTKK